MAFAFSAMVLLGPDHEGYSTFTAAFRALQRIATNEISIAHSVRHEGPGIKKYAKLILHVVYLVLFKWLLTEAVFLGLVLDSWVRTYTTQRAHVQHSMTICRGNCVQRCHDMSRCPCKAVDSIKYVLCDTRRCCSHSYDRCCFEKDGHGRKYMSVSETLQRLVAWKSLDMNSTVRFLNFKLMQMAMQAKLNTDHHGPKKRIHGRARKSAKRVQRLVYDEDVVKMLNCVLIPYFPDTVDHQPHVYTAEQRAFEVVASKKIVQKLTMNAIHTIHYGLDVMEGRQKEAFENMLERSSTLHSQSKQLEARLESLRVVANALERHAPSVNTT